MVCTTCPPMPANMYPAQCRRGIKEAHTLQVHGEPAGLSIISSFIISLSVIGIISSWQHTSLQSHLLHGPSCSYKNGTGRS